MLIYEEYVPFYLFSLENIIFLNVLIKMHYGLNTLSNSGLRLKKNIPGHASINVLREEDFFGTSYFKAPSNIPFRFLHVFARYFAFQLLINKTHHIKMFLFIVCHELKQHTQSSNN